MILGIDIGSCYSKVSVVVDGEYQPGFVEECGEKGIPSILAIDQGRYIIGKQCCTDNHLLNCATIIKEFKTNARKNINDTVPNTDITYAKVIEEFIRYLIKLAQDSAENVGIDKSIESITVTSPASGIDSYASMAEYNNFLCNTVMDITGLSEDEIHIIDEPTAAAIAYLYDKKNNLSSNSSWTVFVFDLGGSSLDLCVVKYDGTCNTYFGIDLTSDLIGTLQWDKKLIDKVWTDLGHPDFKDNSK